MRSMKLTCAACAAVLLQATAFAQSFVDTGKHTQGFGFSCREVANQLGKQGGEIAQDESTRDHRASAIS